MAEVFDPYYIWLGIPPEEQPADYYRLLGIRRFESNGDVIANAADQRVRHLRSMQAGKRQAETQKLLNEISAASGVLLDEERRKEYDARLRAIETVPASPASPEPARPALARRIPVAAALSAARPPGGATPPLSAAPRSPDVAGSASLVVPTAVSSPPSGQVGARSSPYTWAVVVGLVGVVSAMLLVGVTLAILQPWRGKPTSGASGPETSGHQKDRATSTNTARVLKTRRKAYPMPTNWEESHLLPEQRMPAWVFKQSWDKETLNLPAETPMTTLAGSFTAHPGGPGCLATSGRQDSAEFLYRPAPVYQMTLHVKREQGAGPLAIDFPVGGKQCRLVIDSRSSAGFRSGLELVDGKPLSARSDSTVYDGELLLDQTQSVIIIIVGPQGICASITQGNDEFWQFVKFEGDLQRVGRDDKNPAFVPISTGQIGITASETVLVLQGIFVTGGGKPSQVAANSGSKTPPPSNGSFGQNSVSSALPPEKTTTGNGNSSPVKPLELRLGKPVDILADVRPVLPYSGAKLESGRMTTSPQETLSYATFNYPLNGEYLLDASVTRTSGKDGILFGIVVDGRPASVALDCFVEEGKGAHSGLELINNQRLIAANYPAVYKGEVLKNGQRSHVQVAVRKGNVVLQVDGKILIDWTGESRSLSRIHPTLSFANFYLAVGTWKSNYTIDSLKVYPILGSGGTDLTALNPGSSQSPDPLEVTTKDGRTLRVQPLRKTNLLSGVARANVMGDISPRGGMPGVVSAGNDPDRAEFQFPLPAEYIVETQFTRLTGNGAIVLGLVVGGRPVAIVVDGYSNEGHFSGLEKIGGHRLNDSNHPSRQQGRLLTNGKKSTLRVIVQPGRVIADLEGKRIAEWTGDAATLDRDPSHTTPDFRNLSLGTWTRSSFHIESLEIAGIEVTEKSLPPKTKLAVPDKEILAKAREKLQETFGDLEQKGKKPDEKLKLSQEFVAVAASEKDPAVRYALLDLARSLAAAGQDFATAIAVAQSMAAQYEIDESQLKLETLKLAGGTALTASAWESAAELAAELAAAAQESGNLEMADAASQLAVEHAGHSKKTEFKKSIKQLRDTVTARLQLWEVVKAGEKTLQISPDDPAANLAVGKWYCLYVGDWDKGIGQLAKGSDAKLAAAAAAEKEKSELEAADAWSTAAEALSGAEMLAAQRHALALYQQASEELKGLEQLKAAKRVTELSEALAKSDSSLPTAGAMVPRSRLTTDVLRPGLLVRVYASQPPKLPTPALGVIRSYGEFLVRREQLATELKYDAERLCFAGVGYIDLQQDEELLFRVRNGMLIVDGNRVIANNPAAKVTTGPKKKNKNPDQVRRTLKQGRHTLEVRPYDYTLEGPDFRITRDNGESVILYSPDDLEAELAKPVSLHGVSVKGRFSLGNQ